MVYRNPIKTWWSTGAINLGILLIVSLATAALDHTYTLDAENALTRTSNGKTYFEDNGERYELHYDGRGMPAFATGAQSKGHAVRFEIDASDGSCTGTDRSEAILVDDVPMVDQQYVYVGFRVKLPVTTKPNPADQEFTLLKLWQSSGKPAIFTFGLSTERNQVDNYEWEALVRSGSQNTTKEVWLADSYFLDSNDPGRAPFNRIGASLRPGVWHSFVFRFHIKPPKSDGSDNASVKIWKDGLVFKDSVNRAIGYYGVSSNPNQYQIKIGLYKDCQKDSTTDYMVDFDQVRVATDWSEVYPW